MKCQMKSIDTIRRIAYILDDDEVEWNCHFYWNHCWSSICQYLSWICHLFFHICTKNYSIDFLFICIEPFIHSIHSTSMHFVWNFHFRIANNFWNARKCFKYWQYLYTLLLWCIVQIRLAYWHKRDDLWHLCMLKMVQF